MQLSHETNLESCLIISIISIISIVVIINTAIMLIIIVATLIYIHSYRQQARKAVMLSSARSSPTFAACR